MSASSLVSGIPGVRRYAVGDRAGKAIEPQGAEARAPEITSVVSAIGQELSRLASLLNLGALEIANSRGTEATWVMAFRGEMTLAVETEPSRPLGQLESTLLSSDWATQSEWVVTDSQIDYAPAPPQRAGLVVAPPKPTLGGPPRPGPNAEFRGADPRSGTLAAAPAAQRRVTPDGSRTKPAKTVSVAAEFKGLRRALIQGQLSRAETIAARIRETPAAEGDANALAATEASLRPVIDGIASVLAGDNQGGLRSLVQVGDAARFGSSLKWVADIWSARALTGIVDGLLAAGRHAESALMLATQLDDEARAVSALLWAEIALLQGELDRAIALTRNARELFVTLGDHQELASGWLLEARILLAFGREQESVQAAERAHHYRPSWHPPATFIAKSALRSGRVADAEQVMKPLFERAQLAPEVERSRRLLERVRSGALQAEVVAEFLRLLEEIPTKANLKKLEQLAEKHPKVEHFRDALGWKLLRAGDYEAASQSFQRLSSRAELPDEVRSSVLLGLGCLAAVEARHDKTGIKLRAAVNAAPKNMPHAQPTPPSAAKIPKANPIEFRVVEPPQDVMGSGFSAEENQTSPRKARGGPVFAGSLQVFCLPDLLEFLRAGQKTGTLVCSSVAGIGAIHMRAGRVTGAVAPETLGICDYLERQGVVSHEQVRTAVADQERTVPRPLIGGVLVRQLVASPDEIRRALGAQIQDAIGELLRWGDGQFAFDPEVPVDPSSSEVDIALDPQGILLEIFRELDENARMAP